MLNTTFNTVSYLNICPIYNMKDLKVKTLKNVRYDKSVSTPIFNDQSFLFIVKKTEKFSIVTYLITDKIVESDPLKWDLRKLGNDLYKEVMSLRKVNFENGTTVHNKVCDVSETITTLLAHYEIALHARYISAMNYEIIKDELSKLYEYVDRYVQEKSLGSVFKIKDHMFEVEVKGQKKSESVKRNIQKRKFLKEEDGSGDTKKVFYKEKYSTSSKERNIKSPLIKNARKEDIIRIVKDKGSVSIKDVSSLIKDCSEKTIQRELLALVKDNILIKEGERRWSTYRLISS